VCGIIGILKLKNKSLPYSLLTRAQDAVIHRGPDDSGSILLKHSGSFWEIAKSEEYNWQIGLAFRRLSILDLTPAGHQPMVYQDRYWIIYNGEVYNYIELRDKLKKLGHSFHSQSDTEVILAAYAEWGTDCFTHFRGMWGLVIFDSLQNVVILSRDRMGIKPLYLWEGDGMVAIASEIKQFMPLPGFISKLDLDVGSEFLNTGYEDPDRSFFIGVKPIPAGTWTRISLDTLKSSFPVPFWHPEKIRVSVFDKDEAGCLFVQKLLESVRLHLRSDVPVGCALSGGLDSSSIAVLIHQLQKESPNELHTFTSSLPGTNVNEAEYADEIASLIDSTQHLNTPDPQTFLQDLDRFVWIHDEPVGSLSMYASYCLARLTRQHNIPVMLNGQGGDEILSGYWQTYFLFLRENFLKGKWLDVTRHYIGAILSHGNPELVRQTPVMLRRYLSRTRSNFQICSQAKSEFSIHQTLNKILSLQGQERRVYEIRTMFLPRLLKWDDRNSMAFSVEGRYPFLDHELIELCLSFTPETLYRNGWTKWPIRVGLSDKLPDNILKRRTKFGFETPQNEWLCHSLRPTIETWLKQDRPINALVDHRDIRNLAQLTWNLMGKEGEVGQALFRLFIFDRWLERFNVSCTL
jgi:asparagine synthase (glutamine-hydrolysing)